MHYSELLGILMVSLIISGCSNSSNSPEDTIDLNENKAVSDSTENNISKPISSQNIVENDEYEPADKDEITEKHKALLSSLKNNDGNSSASPIIIEVICESADNEIITAKKGSLLYELKQYDGNPFNMKELDENAWKSMQSDQEIAAWAKNAADLHIKYVFPAIEHMMQSKDPNVVHLAMTLYGKNSARNKKYDESMSFFAKADDVMLNGREQTELNSDELELLLDNYSNKAIASDMFDKDEDRVLFLRKALDIAESGNIELDTNSLSFLYRRYSWAMRHIPERKQESIDFLKKAMKIKSDAGKDTSIIEDELKRVLSGENSGGTGFF